MAACLVAETTTLIAIKRHQQSRLRDKRHSHSTRHLKSAPAESSHRYGRCESPSLLSESAEHGFFKTNGVVLVAAGRVQLKSPLTSCLCQLLSVCKYTLVCEEIWASENQSCLLSHFFLRALVCGEKNTIIKMTCHKI